jgi:hypothetical protein
MLEFKDWFNQNEGMWPMFMAMNSGDWGSQPAQSAHGKPAADQQVVKRGPYKGTPVQVMSVDHANGRASCLIKGKNVILPTNELW